MIASVLGASPASGFSTRSATATTSPPGSAPSAGTTQPYLLISTGPTSSSAITTPPCSAYTSIIGARRSSRSSTRSSGRSTASGSPAANLSPCAIASPSPRGCSCSTNSTSASELARRISSMLAASSLASRAASSSSSGAKYSAMAGLPGWFTITTSVIPAPAASAMTSSRVGVVTIGASSLGTALVKGRNRVPRPAAGISALRTGELILRSVTGQYSWGGRPGPRRRQGRAARRTDGRAARADRRGTGAGAGGGPGARPHPLLYRGGGRVRGG